MLTIKRTSLFALAAFTSTAWSQTIPPLPDRIEPGMNDKSYFLCSVTSINDDPQARSLYGKTTNLWTKAVKGGKYELVNPTLVRVMAPNAEAARKDIHGFYQAHAAAAYVRSPLYDSKGQKSIEAVVSKCEPDTSRATNVTLSTVAKSGYRKLGTDIEHLAFAMKIAAKPASDEKLAGWYDLSSLPADVFEKQDAIKKRAAEVKAAIAAVPAGKNIVLTGEVTIQAYSFDAQTFAVQQLQGAVSQYSYSFKTVNGRPVQQRQLPTFDITVPAALNAYKPASVDEAKRIEKVRAANGGRLVLTSYIQATESRIGRDDKPEVLGTLAGIEVADKQGNVLFSHFTK